MVSAHRHGACGLHDLHHCGHLWLGELGLADLDEGLGDVLPVLYLETEGHCASQVDADIVHSAPEVLTEDTIPRVTVDLEGGLEKKHREAASELHLGLRLERDVQVFDTLVEYVERDLDSEQRLDDVQDLELAAGRNLE